MSNRFGRLMAQKKSQKSGKKVGEKTNLSEKTHSAFPRWPILSIIKKFGHNNTENNFVFVHEYSGIKLPGIN